VLVPTLVLVRLLYLRAEQNARDDLVRRLAFLIQDELWRRKDTDRPTMLEPEAFSFASQELLRVYEPGFVATELDHDATLQRLVRLHLENSADVDVSAMIQHDAPVNCISWVGHGPKPAPPASPLKLRIQT